MSDTKLLSVFRNTPLTEHDAMYTCGERWREYGTYIAQQEHTSLQTPFCRHHPELTCGCVNDVLPAYVCINGQQVLHKATQQALTQCRAHLALTQRDE
jgi:hypothetical protein